MPNMDVTITAQSQGATVRGSIQRTAPTGSRIEITVPAGSAGTLTTRTSASQGTVTLAEGHGIESAAVVDLHWAGGVRYGITVGTVAGTSVPLTNSGAGNDLPAAATAVVVSQRVRIKEQIDRTALVTISAAVDYPGNLVATGLVHADCRDDEGNPSGAFVVRANQPRNWEGDGWPAEVIREIWVSNSHPTQAARLRMAWLQEAMGEVETPPEPVEPLLTHMFDGVQAPPLFHRRDGGSPQNYKRAPSFARSSTGRMFIVVTSASALVDDDNSAFGIVYSDDECQTFSPINMILTEPPDSQARTTGGQIIAVGTHICVIFMTAATVDPTTGSRCWMIESTDNGETWGAPTELLDVIVQGENDPVGHTFGDDAWDIVFSGANTCVLEGGPHAGRWIVPLYHRYDESGRAQLHVIYRDGVGDTWHLGGGPPQDANNGPVGESAICELGDVDGNPSGVILINSRYIEDGVPRMSHISTDGGMTFGNGISNTDLQVVENEGAMIRVPGTQTLLLILPAGHYTTDNYRFDMRIYVSFDNGATWPRSRVLYPGAAAYAALWLVGDKVYFAYEAGDDGVTGLTTVAAGQLATTWARKMRIGWCNLAYLLDTDEYPRITHYFNDFLPGERVTIQGMSVQDYGPMAFGAKVEGTTLPQYVADGDLVGMEFTSGDDRLMLSSSRQRAYKPTAGESFGQQFAFKTSSSSTMVLRASNATGARIQVSLSSGVATAVVSDGTTTATVTGGSNLDNGARHTIAIERDHDAGEIRLRVDGDIVDTETSDYPGGDIASESTHHVYLCSTIAGGSYFEGVLLGHDWVRTRCFTDAEIWRPETFTQPPSLGPSDWDMSDFPAALQEPYLYLAPPSQETFRHCFTGLTFGDYAPPYYADWRGMQGWLDPARNFIAVESDNHGIECVTDPGTGLRYWRFRSGANTTPGPRVYRSASGALRNIHRTGIGTIAMLFREDSLPVSTAQTAFDSSAGGSSQSGFGVSISSSGGVGLYVTNGSGTSRLSTANGTLSGTITAGQWYLAHWRLTGAGNSVFGGLTPLANETINETTLNTLGGSNVETDMTYDMKIGGRASGSYIPLQGDIHALMISGAASTADVQALFDLWKAA